MKSPRQVAASLLWNYVGKIADSGGMYIVGIIVAHALGVRNYASYALALSGMHLVVALSSAGIEVALNRFLPALAADGKGSTIRFLVKRVLLIRVILALIVSCALYVLLDLSGVFATVFPGAAAFLLFAIMRSVVPLLAMSMVAQLHTKIPSVISSSIRLADVVVVSVIASAGGTVQDFMIGLACTSVIHAVVLLMFLRPPIGGPTTVTPLLPILSFGGIYSINVMVNFVLGRFGDVVLLGKLCPDQNQTGLYEVGAGLVQAASLLMITGMGGVNLALFSEMATRHGIDRRRIQDFYHGLVRIISALTIPLMAFLVVDADLVVQALYSSRFAGAADIVRAFAAVRIAARLFGGGENTDSLLAFGKAALVSTLGVSAAIINIAGDVLLIPHFGAFGPVIATSTAELAATCGTFFAAKAIVGVRLQPSIYVRLLAGCLPGALLLAMISHGMGVPSLVQNILIFGVLTMCMWVLLKPFRRSDMEILSRVYQPLASFLLPFVRREDR